MAVDYSALKQYGTDDAALRLLFTMPDSGGELSAAHEKYLDDYVERLKKNGGERINETAERKRMEARMRKGRSVWQKRICSRIEEARVKNYKNYRWHYAADLAWDGPIFADQVPLMLYAQGRIDVEKCAETLKDAMGEERAKEYIEFDEKKGITPVGINAAKLGEKVINVIRPYLTRRKAALSEKYNGLHPWISYEPRNRTMTGKIQAAVTTERIDQVVDMRGVRHDFTQWVHKMLMHSGQWVFVNHPWFVEKGIRTNEAGNVENYVKSEGPILDHPHPTRTFSDPSHPPSSVNFDKGVTYCGYWDVIPYRDIKDNPNYFNASNIKYSTSLQEEFRSYRNFFEAYYDEPNKIKVVPPSRNDPFDSMQNDRKSLEGLYNDDDGDCSVFFTHYYERVVPREMGFGTYPLPVWVKLTVANDKTVVRARILPSRPGFYVAHNQDDTRDQNLSMVHEMIPYQDQAQTLVSQLYYLLRLEQILLLAVDTDLIPDKKMRKQLQDYLKGKRDRFEAFYMEWSGTRVREIQRTQAQDPFQFVSSSIQPQIQTTLKGIGETLNLMEKMLMMSPQELGQYVTKETNATEVTSVNKTTNSLNSYLAEGPDEARGALKVIFYESFMALGEDSVPVPVVAQFPEEAVRKAGFEFVEEEESEEEGEQEHFVIRAKKSKMVFAYIYNSRDGTERTVSAEASKTLYQFVTQILANEMLLDLFGWKQVAEMISEVFRMSGSPFAIKLPSDLPEGRPSQAKNGEVQQQLQQFQQQWQQFTQQVSERLDGHEESIVELEEAMTTALKRISDAAEAA